MDAMFALLPEDEVPGSLFLERLLVKMRDHLVAREFKNPSEIALHAIILWDARRAQAADSLLFSPACAQDRERTHDQNDVSPARRNQTPGPAGSGECYFHKHFGSSANNCRPPCSFQGNARADGRRRN